MNIRILNTPVHLKVNDQHSYLLEYKIKSTKSSKNYEMFVCTYS